MHPQVYQYRFRGMGTCKRWPLYCRTEGVTISYVVGMSGPWDSAGLFLKNYLATEREGWLSKPSYMWVCQARGTGASVERRCYQGSSSFLPTVIVIIINFFADEDEGSFEEGETYLLNILHSSSKSKKEK